MPFPISGSASVAQFALSLINSPDSLSVREVVLISTGLCGILASALATVFWLLIKELRSSVYKQLEIRATILELNALLSEIPKALRDHHRRSAEHLNGLTDLAKVLKGMAALCERFQSGK